LDKYKCLIISHLLIDSGAGQHEKIAPAPFPVLPAPFPVLLAVVSCVACASLCPTCATFYI
jgi:hypothetical protein